MTQAVATQSRPPINAGGQIAALIPQSLDEAFRVATAIAASGLAPKGLEKPEQVLVSIMAGAELGFAPFQSMQSFAVVNGKPNLWGDALPALLWSRGFDLEEWFDDDDAPTKAFCKVTRPSGKEIERTFSLIDAKKANLIGKQGPWQTNQKRMLQMRARAFAARDGAADVLRGMPVYEEVQDHELIRGAAPEKSGVMARLTGQGTGPGFTETAVAEALGEELPKTVDDIDAVLEGDNLPAHDRETGEVIEGETAEFTETTTDVFPGDDPAPSSSTREAAGEATNPAAGGGKTPIAARIADFHSRIQLAKSTVKLTGLYAASSALRDELAAMDDPRLTEIDDAFNARFIAVEAEEKAAR